MYRMVSINAIKTVIIRDFHVTTMSSTISVASYSSILISCQLESQNGGRASSDAGIQNRPRVLVAY